MSRLCSTTKII